jgi:hypothetical protein
MRENPLNDDTRKEDRKFSIAGLLVFVVLASIRL